MEILLYMVLFIIAGGASFWAFLSWLVYVGKNPWLAGAIALFAIGVVAFFTGLRVH